MEGETITPEEQQIRDEILKNYGSPQVEEKHNIHKFLHTVSTSTDTTKTGNLNDTELGVTRYAERSYKNMALMSSELATDDIWAKYFNAKAEILTATSLSRDAKLLSLAVLQRKELADVTPQRKENPSWFKKKDKTPSTQSAD